MRELRCTAHPESPVRRYRTHGPRGPGVYPQCLPRNGEEPHLLDWPEPMSELAGQPDLAALTPSELDLLADATNGMTVLETAANRSKSPETVKTQRTSIMLKLEARNMAHAVGIASRSRRDEDWTAA